MKLAQRLPVFLALVLIGSLLNKSEGKHPVIDVKAEPILLLGCSEYGCQTAYTNVEASADDGNVAANVLDCDPDTRWAARGQGEFLTVTLDQVYQLSFIEIAFHRGNNRVADFDLEVSIDGENYTNLGRQFLSSGNTLDFERFTFDQIAAKYVRYVGYGNSSNDWNAITGFRIPLEGQSCNDGNACTINDVYDANCNCVGTPQDDPATGLSINTTDERCEAGNGSITFNFPDTNGRTNIEFSIDGGNTWPNAYNVPDNSGSLTINDLPPGTYEPFVRWGNDECPQALPSQTIDADPLPNVTVEVQEENCGIGNGSITFSFEDVGKRTNIEFSIDGGNSWPAAYNVPDNSGSFTINDLQAGSYELLVRWGNNQCPVNLGTITIEDDPLPSATVSSFDENCGNSSGGILFEFSDVPERTNIEFSIDGGSSWPDEYNVADNAGSLLIENLSPGTYDLYVRWGNNECPVALGTKTINADPLPDVSVSASDASCGLEDGSITFEFSDAAQRDYIEFSIDGGNTFPIAYYVEDNTGSLTIGSLSTGTYSLYTRWGNDDCPVRLQDVTIDEGNAPSIQAEAVNGDCGQNGGSLVISIQDDPQESQIALSIDGGNSFPNEYLVNDDIGQFTINNLNPGTYQLAARWSGGNCTIVGETYTLSSGEKPVVSLSTSSEDCEDDAGSINFSFEESPNNSRLSISLDGGNTYPEEYKVAGNAGSFNIGGLAPGTYSVFAQWEGSNCAVDVGEATIEEDPLPSAQLVVFNERCGAGLGSIIITFDDNPNRDRISFSIDGGNSFPPNYVVQDNTGNLTITEIPAGTYEIVARWSDESCTTTLGTVEILKLNIGILCDDGDPNTINDAYDENCNCVGTFEDDDRDGVGNSDDVCPGFDDNLLGTPCDDGDSTTVGDTYVDCQCIGNVEDDDGDGVSNPFDLCPDFDDKLLGTSCDDGDPATSNDIYVDCECQGVILDDDGDGVPNNLDVCPDFDDDLLGTSCDDGDPNTIGDVYIDCECKGNVGDDDGDGIGNDKDQCPAFDDKLLGSACDDGDPNTINDTYNNCSCSGEFQDDDGDGIGNADDQCPAFDNALIGTPCDDGDECTTNDVYQDDCSCRGEPIFSAATINNWFSYFQATHDNCFTVLEWEIPACTPILPFYVLERSIDETFFSKGREVVIERENTTYQDTISVSFKEQAVYYRLRLVTESYASVYSPIIKINADCEPTLRVYPNPMKESFTLSLNLIPEQAYSIYVNTPHGKFMYNSVVIGGPSGNTLSIKTEDWPQGIYYLIVTDGDNTFYRMLQVEK